MRLDGPKQQLVLRLSHLNEVFCRFSYYNVVSLHVKSHDLNFFFFLCCPYFLFGDIRQPHCLVIYSMYYIIYSHSIYLRAESSILRSEFCFISTVFSKWCECIKYWWEMFKQLALKLGELLFWRLWFKALIKQ